MPGSGSLYQPICLGVRKDVEPAPSANLIFYSLIFDTCIQAEPMFAFRQEHASELYLFGG